MTDYSSDRNLALDAVRVTESAALSSARTMGRGDKNAADDAAVTAMRKAFNSLHICGTVVIGEGELDEAPMLFIGEKVGRWDPEDPVIDLALDPLEGTNLCSKGLPNAIAVIAMAREGEFLHAPDMYMYKIVVGHNARGAIDMNRSARWNVSSVADAKRVNVQDLTVMILDRPRHVELIHEVRETGARIKLIADGDVSGAIATCKEEAGVDILIGIGGAPEGVISAAAVRCFGGDMQAQLRPTNQNEIDRARQMGVRDINKIFSLTELARGDVLFAATGVTDGDFLRGPRFRAGGATTHSVVMRSKTKTIRYINTEYLQSVGGLEIDGEKD